MKTSLVCIVSAFLVIGCTSGNEEEEEYTEVQTDLGITDAPREEAEPLKLEPLTNTAMVDFLASSEEGWGEAFLDGNYPIAASDDENAKLEDFSVWKDGSAYKMQLNKDDEYTIAACGEIDSEGQYELILLTENDINAGDSFGKMVWMEKRGDDAVEVSFLDPMNARVASTKIFGRFCELYVCHPKRIQKVVLISISVVEGLYGFHFKDETGQELNFYHHKLDFDRLEGLIFEHEDDGSIFGNYKILNSDPVRITFQNQVIENDMEPGDYSDADVLLDIQQIQ